MGLGGAPSAPTIYKAPELQAPPVQQRAENVKAAELGSNAEFNADGTAKKKGKASLRIERINQQQNIDPTGANIV